MSDRLQQYDIAYSLGDTCGAALYMRRRMMRFASGPFDWLAGGDFHTRIDAIMTDFRDFLHQEDLELRERDFGYGLTFEHDYYHNVRNGLRHYHDIKTGALLAEAFPKVQEKYERRIRRFQHHLAHSKVLLIWFSLGQHTADEEILRGYEQLSQKYGKNIHLLIIEHTDDKEIVYRRLNENIERYSTYLHVYDEAGVVRTLGDIPKTNRILRNYAVANSRWLLFKKQAVNFVIRLFTALIPVKSLRKRIRRKLYGSSEMTW